MAGIYPSRDAPNASNLKRKCWPTAITLRTRRICSSALGTRVSTLTASSFLKTVLLKPSSLKRLRIFQLHRTRLCPRETLIKLSLSTANAATVSADEAEDTGDDEWIRALQQKDAAGIVFGRDGAGGALEQAMRADRALLPDGG